MVTLKNDQLSIVISEKGAELQSVKDASGLEYLWQGDPKYWPRRSPILFPIVCSVNDNTYRVSGQEYHLPRHGFARDMTFSLISKTERKVTLALSASDETLKVYPYNFVLSISYVLDGNKISVIWHVHNADVREMHFQIGGHPAFNIPGMREGERQHGLLLLDNPGSMQALHSYGDGSHEMNEVPFVEAKEGVMAFTDKTWQNDSIKIAGSQLHRAVLAKTDGTAAVTVDFLSPVIAFWSPFGKEAPFVCIEPWYGVGDPRGFKGEFSEKPFINHLLPGASWMAKYEITIG